MFHNACFVVLYSVCVFVYTRFVWRTKNGKKLRDNFWLSLSLPTPDDERQLLRMSILQFFFSHFDDFHFFFLLCSFRTGFVIIQGTRIGFEPVVYIFPWEKFLIFFQPLLCFLFAFPIVLDFCCSFHVSSFARSLRFSLHSALLFAFYLFIPVKMYTLESSKYTLCQSVFVHLFLYCCARNSNFYMRRAIYKFHIYLFIYLLPSPSAASNGVSWRVIQNQTRKREAESGKKQQQNYGYFVCDCEKLFLSPSKKNKREWSSFAAKKSGRRTKTHAKERKEKAAKSVDDD